MGRGPDQLVKTRGPHHGSGGAAHVDAYISLAAAHAGPLIVLLIVAVETTFHGQRPGPACENTWAASCAGGSDPRRCPHLIGRGPPRPIKFSDHGARPDPAHHLKKKLGPARPGPS